MQLSFSRQDTHFLPKDAAIVAVDLVDAVQSVCNFLEQRWRNQSSAPDFSSLIRWLDDLDEK